MASDMNRPFQGPVQWDCVLPGGVYLMPFPHYIDVIMGLMASQITSLTIVYSTVYSGADQRKHQSSASLAFVRGIHWRPVNSQHKRPVTRKMFPFDDVIMQTAQQAPDFLHQLHFLYWFNSDRRPRMSHWVPLARLSCAQGNVLQW